MRLHLTLATALAALLPIAGAAQYPPPPPSYPPPPPPGYAPPPTYAPPPGYAPAPAYPQPYQQAPQQPLGGPSVNLFVGESGVTDMSSSYGSIRVDGKESFGVSIEVPVRRAQTVELKWVYANQTAQYVPNSSLYQGTSKFDVVSQFYMIGGNHVIRRGKVETFFGGSIGAMLLQPSHYTQGNITYNPADSWHFNFGLGGGVKLFVAEKAAVRLGLDVYFPVYSSSSAIYVGGGGGTMYTTGYIPSVFGQLTLGLALGG